MFDRGRLSVDALYEVEHFARENGVWPSQVSKLIKKNGNDRLTLTKAVKSCAIGIEKPAALCSTTGRSSVAPSTGVGAGVGCARCGPIVTNDTCPAAWRLPTASWGQFS
ncbi:DUF3606 domain-containing protein [Mesorhizobium sp. M1307]|uniref:hypothetical protein n=1 Tax=Mesorhizobium sp. M1307 TaxID=2957079 RepID=UPI003337469A